MKAIVHDWYTDIILTDAEVKQICKPGTSDCCVWLVCGANGFECSCLHKSHALVDRFQKGLTNAKRDGCTAIKTFNPAGQDGEVEFDLLAVFMDKKWRERFESETGLYEYNNSTQGNNVHSFRQAFIKWLVLQPDKCLERLREYCQVQLDGIQRSSPTDAGEGASLAFNNVLQKIEEISNENGGTTQS